MQLTSRRSAFLSSRSSWSPSALYTALTFGSRSDAVRYCLRLSDALGRSHGAGGEAGEVVGATLWLAAAPVPDGSCIVYACDRALAVAREAGLEAPTAGQIRYDALPMARCLVLGNASVLLRS